MYVNIVSHANTFTGWKMYTTRKKRKKTVWDVLFRKDTLTFLGKTFTDLIPHSCWSLTESNNHHKNCNMQFERRTCFNNKYSKLS